MARSKPISRGKPESVQQVIAAMHEGPPRAQVEQIEEDAAEPEGLDGFTRR